MPKDLHALVNHITDLPTLPQVITRLLRLLDDPASSAEDIHKLLERDPALATKILKLVNSAFYGLPSRISSVRQAVVILGFNTVRSLALSASVFELFGAKGGVVFNRVAFWTHSIAVAAISRTLATRGGGAGAPVEPETAFVAGLLHDLGKLVLDGHAPEEFRQILQRARDGKSTFTAAERELLATDHAEIGAWLAERWHLPGELIEAIGKHHRPGEAPTSAQLLTAIVHFADFICHRKAIGSSGCFALPELDPASWAYLGMEKDDLPQVIQQVNEDLIRSEGLVQAAFGDAPA